MSNNQTRCQPMDWYNDYHHSFNSSYDEWLRYHIESVHCTLYTIKWTYACLYFDWFNALYTYVIQFADVSLFWIFFAWNITTVSRFLLPTHVVFDPLINDVVCALFKRMSSILVRLITFGKEMRKMADSYIDICNSNNNDNYYHIATMINIIQREHRQTHFWQLHRI